jgi:hypothetical protein
MHISSPAFDHGKPIPEQYTCDGRDVSPELRFEDVPAEAGALALILDDPDAPTGTFDHWVLYDLPADAGGLPRNVDNGERPGPGGTHGLNSWQRLGYGGPCPPGGTHRYFFRLYALNAPLELDPGASKQEVLAAMEGRTVAQAELMGTYSR